MIHWQQQAGHIQRALRYPHPIPQDELLIPHAPDGSLMRTMTPEPGVIPREAAVLLLFYPHADDLAFPLTLRSSALPQHSGEISLPGGATDPEDDSAVATALRETHEELGIAPEHVEIWGTLAPLYIHHSNFRLTPVVGFTPSAPHIVPNPTEIAAVFSASLSHLLDPATVRVEEWIRHDTVLRVPFFALEGHTVWGATALLLSELVARMRRVA